MSVALLGRTMSEQPQRPRSPRAKQSGATVRVSEALADALNEIAHVDKKSIAAILDELILETAQKLAVEAIARNNRKWLS